MTAEAKFHVIETGALERYCEFIGLPVDYFRVEGRVSIDEI